LRTAGYRGPVQGLKLRRNDLAEPLSLEVEVTEPIGPQIARLGGGVVEHIDMESEDDGIDWLIVELGSTAIDLRRHRARTAPRAPDEPYWAPIRRHVGHDAIYSPGTAVMVEAHDGRIAAVRRSDDGQWSLPAGSREPGESILDTAIHEVLEETGMDIRLTHLIALVSGPAMAWTYPNGHKAQFTSFFFRAEHIGGDLRVADHENTDVRWITRAEARDLFNPRWTAKLDLFESFDGELQII
jgi:8-oxo-dGTP diphosphatase